MTKDPEFDRCECGHLRKNHDFSERFDYYYYSPCESCECIEFYPVPVEDYND